MTCLAIEFVGGEEEGGGGDRDLPHWFRFQNFMKININSQAEDQLGTIIVWVLAVPGQTTTATAIICRETLSLCLFSIKSFPSSSCSFHFPSFFSKYKGTWRRSFPLIGSRWENSCVTSLPFQRVIRTIMNVNISWLLLIKLQVGPQNTLMENASGMHKVIFFWVAQNILVCTSQKMCVFWGGGSSQLGVPCRCGVIYFRILLWG